MRRHYPLTVKLQRDLSGDSAQVLHIWNLDKSTLDVAHATLAGVATLPLDFAVDKRVIPGMPEVLRGLRWGSSPAYACVPIVFVSAGPPQLRHVLARKMMLDGVEWDGFLFKNWWRILRMAQPWRLREHTGFKLCAWLTLRALQPQRDVFLYGNDSDAQAFSLFHGLIHEGLSAVRAEARLQAAGLHRHDRRCILPLWEQVAAAEGKVRRAFIHIGPSHSPGTLPASPELTPIRNAVDLALALWEEEQVRVEAVRRVIAATLGPFSAETRQRLVEDAGRRGLVSAARLAELG